MNVIETEMPRAGRLPFDARVIDDAPSLLEQSYQLRYQVYCVEREFLRAEDYPHGVEIDEFDNVSIHIGVTDRFGRLAGTARMVRPCGDRLPTFDHCPLLSVLPELWSPTSRVVEISRLCVSRSYGTARPPGTGASRLPSAERSPRGGGASEDRGSVFFAIVKALYQVSKRSRATHWLVATERSLQRFLSRNGFPFHQLGSEFDYLGPVVPYLMDLRELDKVVQSGRYPALADLTVGLEPAFQPWIRDRLEQTVPAFTDTFSPTLAFSAA
jgi:N-acyl amino acid synthase of PEP-CTERM/exosortase system